MSNLENYNKKIAEISALSDEETKSISIPVDTYVQEAENLYVWCTQDKEALSQWRLDWNLVEDIPLRAGALREAESRWITKRFSKEEAGRQWKEESPRGYKLRNELLDILRFAYRKNTELTGRVQAIAEGTGHADMIQDLNDLAVLGRENLPPLEAINLDLSILDEAAALTAELGALLAEATSENSSVEKNIRDKAYTFLKQAVDEVYDYGKFVFRDNAERKKGYTSAYLKKIYRRVRKNQDSGESVAG